MKSKTLLLWSVGLAPVIGALSGPRFYAADYASVVGSGDTSSGSLEAILVRLLLYCAIASACVVLLRSDKRRLFGLGWYVGLGVLCLTTPIVSTIAVGAVPTGALLAGPFIFAAIGWSSSDDPSLTRTIRLILLAYLYGSIALALYDPASVVERDYYDGIVPGLSLRLHGIANHANNLAPLILLFLIIDGSERRRSSIAVLHRFVAVGTLLATQSKTTWAAGAVIIALASVRWGWDGRYVRRDRIARLGMRKLVVVAIVVMFLSTAFGAMFSSSDSIRTLTGRTTLWQLSVDLWRERPLLGFGEQFWGTQMRQDYLVYQGLVVTHAHNDVLQALGQSGLIGLGVMAAYLFATISTSLRTAEISQWRTVFLAGLILTRMSTEPLVTSQFGTPNFAVHVFIFVLFAQAAVSCRQTSLSIPTANIAPNRHTVIQSSYSDRRKLPVKIIAALNRQPATDT